jgi:type I restriction enzyme R subunit
LVRYKYPPDKQLEAIRLVIEQMERMAPTFVPTSAGEGQNPRDNRGQILDDPNPPA